MVVVCGSGSGGGSLNGSGSGRGSSSNANRLDVGLIFFHISGFVWVCALTSGGQGFLGADMSVLPVLTLFCMCSVGNRA